MPKISWRPTPGSLISIEPMTAIRREEGRQLLVVSVKPLKKRYGSDYKNDYEVEVIGSGGVLVTMTSSVFNNQRVIQTYRWAQRDALGIRDGLYTWYAL